MNEIVDVKVTKTKCFGFVVLDDGTVQDFECTVMKRFNKLSSASNYVRRIYANSSITIARIESDVSVYRVPLGIIEEHAV